MADWSEWQQEVRAQVVIGTASTLSGFLDRGVVDPSNVKAFVVDLGNNDPSVREYSTAASGPRPISMPSGTNVRICCGVLSEPGGGGESYNPRAV